MLNIEPREPPETRKSTQEHLQGRRESPKSTQSVAKRLQRTPKEPPKCNHRPNEKLGICAPAEARASFFKKSRGDEREPQETLKSPQENRQLRQENLKTMQQEAKIPPRQPQTHPKTIRSSPQTLQD